MTPQQLVQSYYEYWSTGKFDQALRLLSTDLKVEVPINNYPTRESFMDAVKFTSAMMDSSELIASFSEGSKAVVVYDMTLKQFGKLRVAEYYIIKEGKISRLCQIHDTAPFRN